MEGGDGLSGKAEHTAQMRRSRCMGGWFSVAFILLVKYNTRASTEGEKQEGDGCVRNNLEHLV